MASGYDDFSEVNPRRGKEAPKKASYDDFSEVGEKRDPKGGGSLLQTAIQPFTGLNKGLADLINAPGRLLNAAGQMVGLPDMAEKYKVYGTGALEAGSKQFPPQTGPQMLMNTVGEVAGSNVLPMVGAYAAAPRAVAGALSRASGAPITSLPAAMATPGGAPSLTRTMLEPMITAPGKVAAIEGLATLGAGTGLHIARTEEMGPTGEMLMQLAGGMAPAAAPAIVAKLPSVRGAKALAQRGIPEEATDAFAAAIAPDGTPPGSFRARLAEKAKNLTAGQRDEAFRQVRPILEDEVKLADPRRVAEMRDIDATVPGTRFTLAEQIESPKLIERQKGFSDTMTAAEVGQELARREANRKAIEAAKTAAAPRGPDDPEFIIDVSRRALAGREQAIRNSEYRLDTETGEMVARVRAAAGDRSTVGGTIRDALTEARNQTRARMRQEAERLGLNRPDGVNIATLRDTLVDTYRNTSALRSADGAAATAEHPIVRRITDLADRQPISAIAQLRSEISDELSTVLRNPTPGNASQRRGLAAMIERLDGEMDNLGRAIADPNLAQNYAQFRQIYRTEYADRFERGTTYKVLGRDGRRDYRIRDEEVARAFFQPNNRTAAEQFAAVFGADNPMIMSAAMDSLERAAITNGVFSERAFQTWMKAHRDVIDVFPGVRQATRDMASALDNIGANRRMLADRREGIEASIFARELKAYETGARTADEVVDRLLTNPRRVGEFKRFLNSQEANDALARVSWERMFTASNPMEFASRNAEALRIALGQERYNRAMVLLRTIRKADLVPAPVGKDVPAQPTVAAVEEKLNTGLNQLSSRIFAWHSGRTSLRYVATDVMGRVMRGYSQRQADRVMMEAMLDPDVGRRLTGMLQQPMTPERARAFYTYMTSVGLGPDLRESERAE